MKINETESFVTDTMRNDTPVNREAENHPLSNDDQVQRFP